jgi:hypothetical protein
MVAGLYGDDRVGRITLCTRRRRFRSDGARWKSLGDLNEAAGAAADGHSGNS